MGQRGAHATDMPSFLLLRDYTEFSNETNVNTYLVIELTIPLNYGRFFPSPCPAPTQAQPILSRYLESTVE